jgi:hypothetical protein
LKLPARKIDYYCKIVGKTIKQVEEEEKRATKTSQNRKIKLSTTIYSNIYKNYSNMQINDWWEILDWYCLSLNENWRKQYSEMSQWGKPKVKSLIGEEIELDYQELFY